MSMLAGPRRKQKVINLRAKNSAWSNDNSKFGQRMLEKMGWSSGKGLGAKEDGIVEHVVARYKNDEKGLGFEDKNDQWTKHEDDFNALLANLSNGDSTEEKLHSGVSLEVKSKSSKARVHYHKFTRGKDLTRYSEKDLANIFGKKSLKNVVEPPVVEEVNVEEIKTIEQVFTEKGSMEDYFKNKLLALKTKVSFNKLQNDDEENDFAFKGFSGTQNDSEYPCDEGFQGFSFYNHNTDEVTDNVVEKSTENKYKKKKKKDKSVKVEEENEINENQHVKDLPEPIVGIKKKKSKSKSKIKSDELPLVDEVENFENINEEPEKDEVPVKKKKSKKRKEVAEETHEQNNEFENTFVPKKKKKRKNKDNEI